MSQIETGNVDAPGSAPEPAAQEVEAEFAAGRVQRPARAMAAE